MMDDDDQMVQTAMTATKMDYIGAKMTEHTICCKIPSYRKGHANHDNFQLHVQLLRKLSQTLDSTKLRIIDNKNTN
jgi:hypothetical protein